MFEVEDVQWFRGTDYIRTGTRASTCRCRAPTTSRARPFGPVERVVHRDRPPLHRPTLARRRTTWETLATQLTTTTFDWPATGPATTNAIVRVLSYDTHARSSAAMTPRRRSRSRRGPRTARSRSTGRNSWSRGSGRYVLSWKPPVTDLAHGPADRYHVYRGTDPQNLVEVALVYTNDYREEAGAPEPGLVYYRIVAANAAGDAH